MKNNIKMEDFRYSLSLIRITRDINVQSPTIDWHVSESNENRMFSLSYQTISNLYWKIWFCCEKSSFKIMVNRKETNSSKSFL